MAPTFADWKRQLLRAAGDASAPIRHLGDHVLESFWRDGCEPDLSALLDYSQAGLCEKYRIRASYRDRSANPGDTARP